MGWMQLICKAMKIAFESLLKRSCCDVSWGKSRL
jgi:hypothetical protein